MNDYEKFYYMIFGAVTVVGFVILIGALSRALKEEGRNEVINDLKEAARTRKKAQAQEQGEGQVQSEAESQNATAQ